MPVTLPTSRAILVSRPDFDVITQFGSWHLGKFAEDAIAHGFTVVDLFSDGANKTQFKNALDTADPLLCYGIGHGSETTFTGQNVQKILEVGINEGWMAGRITHLLSCMTAVTLGHAIIEAGGVAYFGYDISWGTWIDTSKTPEEDVLSYGNFESDAWIDRQLIRGATTRSAYDAAIAKYNEWIRIWQTNPPSPSDANVVIVSLINNRDALCFYGDPRQRVGAPSPILAGMGALALGLLSGWMIKK